MDTTYNPVFFLSKDGLLITSRFVKFEKLCSLFADEVYEGRDPSAKILTKLTKYPPLRDVPEMNEAFDLMKDSIFAYHMASTRDYHELGIKIRHPGYFVGKHSMPCNSSAWRYRCDTFLTGKKMYLCVDTFWELEQACDDHSAALWRLQNSLKTYQELTRKCIKANRKLQASTDKLYACTYNAEGRIIIGAESLHAYENCVQHTKEYIKYKEKSKKAQEKLEPLYKTEKKIREEKLNTLEEELRSVIETEMRITLSEGMQNLRKVAYASRFPQKLIDRLDSFDCHQAAVKVYRDLSIKYIHPVIDQSCLDTPLGKASFARAHVRVMGKAEQRLRAHGSNISALEGELHESRQEELYVWSNTSLDETDKDYQLRLRTDTKIKQKFCSADGSLAFGWTRKFGGTKKYGFYPACATRLVP